jgi:hypothetical protein
MVSQLAWHSGKGILAPTILVVTKTYFFLPPRFLVCAFLSQFLAIFRKLVAAHFHVMSSVREFPFMPSL